MSSCTPLPKAAKLVWANQMTRLPCIVVNVKFQLVYSTTSEIGSPPVPLRSLSLNLLIFSWPLPIEYKHNLLFAV